MIHECVITQQEAAEDPATDSYFMARMLKAKGFVCTGGPLQPKLSGEVSHIQDQETLNYHFKQTVKD